MVSARNSLEVAVQRTPNGQLQIVRGVEDDNLEIVNGEVILVGTYEELMKARDAINRMPRKLMTEEQRAARVEDSIGTFYGYEVARLINGKYVVGNLMKNDDGTLDDSELEGVRYTVKDIDDLETLREELEEWALEIFDDDDCMDVRESSVAEQPPEEE